MTSQLDATIILLDLVFSFVTIKTVKKMSTTVLWYESRKSLLRLVSLMAWGVLEQRLGNLSAAKRLFRSSLNINSQSYVTWMTWASLEEDQGNPIRVEEIWNLYFQQHTEVMGFLDITDPALDSIKQLLNLNEISDCKGQDLLRSLRGTNSRLSEDSSSLSNPIDGNSKGSDVDINIPPSDFDLDAFVKYKLSLDLAQLDGLLQVYEPRNIKSSRRIWRSKRKTLAHF